MHEKFFLDLPRNYKVLHVGVQGDKPYIWIEHFLPDTGHLTSKVPFLLLLTGDRHTREKGYEFIHCGSFLLSLDQNKSQFVGHVYRERKVSEALNTSMWQSQELASFGEMNDRRGMAGLHTQILSTKGV